MVPCPEEVFRTGLDLLQRQIGPALSLRRVRKANDQAVGAPRASSNLLWAGLGGTRERNFLAGEIDSVFSYKVRADSGVADMYWTSTVA